MLPKLMIYLQQNKIVTHQIPKPDIRIQISNGRSWRAPCKGGVSQWVQIPPGDVAPAGSNRSSHGGNEVAEASGVEGH